MAMMAHNYMQNIERSSAVHLYYFDNIPTQIPHRMRAQVHSVYISPFIGKAKQQRICIRSKFKVFENWYTTLGYAQQHIQSSLPIHAHIFILDSIASRIEI